MLVPRSFSYASSLPKDTCSERRTPAQSRKTVTTMKEKRTGFRPASPARTTTEPVRVPSPPISFRAPAHLDTSARNVTDARKDGAATEGRKKPPAHDPRALPPAVAALLAVTQIPRHKASQLRQQPKHSRAVSIDDLVSEWKNDEALSASYESSPGMSILLEDPESEESHSWIEQSSVTAEGFLSERSTSAESVPSLETDDQSILSHDSPSTPESLRSRKSSYNSKKEKSRSSATTEECALSHPLITTHSSEADLGEEFILSPSTAIAKSHPKSKSRFTSNLTRSLQNLKNAALNSVSSFSFVGSNSETSESSLSRRAPGSEFPDDLLWSHPFLFPRFTPDARPVMDGTPTEAQRRYLNPPPLSFEEQEAPYQLALHAPYLAEAIEGAPAIQMQTYSRGKRKSGSKRGGLDPQSEAGRALLGAAGVRHREPRENSDFLRVVVMEMNMKRAGKLETGRAKLWLPPRKGNPIPRKSGKVPRRWIGESVGASES